MKVYEIETKYGDLYGWDEKGDPKFFRTREGCQKHIDKLVSQGMFPKGHLRVSSTTTGALRSEAGLTLGQINKILQDD